MSAPTKIDKPLLHRMYCDEKKTIAEIADEFGVSYRTMRKRLLRAGVQLRSPKEARVLSFQRRGKPGALDRKFLWREYVKRGRTTVEIARDLGVAAQTISYHLKKAGIARRSSKVRMKQIWSDPGFRERMTGSNSFAWNGGQRKNQGYLQIQTPEHPDADVRGYVFQHRLVMEQIIGRRLKPEERVHHKNGNKCDNRPENLQLFANDSEHAKYHHAMKQSIHRLLGLYLLTKIVTWIERRIA